MHTGPRTGWALALLAGLAGCGRDSGPAPLAGDANPYAGYRSEVYGGTANWLCHPGLAAGSSACDGDLSTVVVQADGSATIQPFTPAAAPAVDCFYVYPTVSADPADNSDRMPDLQEIETTLMQAARYGAVCRVFAPVYRQRTLTLLALDSVADELVTDEQQQAAGEIAYADVVDAFREYVASHNAGRGFLLLGHSQGARIAARLVAEEVEQHPYLAQRMVAAHIPGITLAVPKGAETGGTFRSTPPCRSAQQTGCVIGYSSYRQGDPELSAPRFGVTGDPGTLALCANPAALAGGAGDLDLHVPFRLPPVFQALLIPRGTGGPYADRLANLTAGAPFYAVPGQLQAQCRVDEALGVSYLEISITADPADPRADDYPGEFFGGTGWGLHLADVNLAQGNLVRIARAQAEAWLQAR